MSTPPSSPRAEQRRRTIAAYQADARTYRDSTQDLSDAVGRAMDQFAERCGPGASILEIGSGPGRDALALEQRGLTVDRTDITPAFVDLMRADGHRAKVVDPLVDAIGGPYRGVWANAVLLHLDRYEAPVVLYRLAQATVPGGWLSASVKVGDGETWVTRGTIAGERHFTFWQQDSWMSALAAAGWEVVDVEQGPGRQTDTWLRTLAQRPLEAGDREAV